jgi:2-C-methyl-D-erythritol 2,4-cyclodiphosphate synthase
MKIRVGFGYDLHRLKEGRELWLGGIKIDHSKGAVGHSDADVLIHAICDALLGAANLRDIGYHFPDSDLKFKGIDSKLLLKEVHSLLKSKDWKVGNIDCTVNLQTPKISNLILEMRNVISPILLINIEDISIKATTGERIGIIGKEEGVAAYAVVLINK